jgi:hypothetical protein
MYYPLFSIQAEPERPIPIYWIDGVSQFNRLIRTTFIIVYCVLFLTARSILHYYTRSSERQGLPVPHIKYRLQNIEMLDIFEASLPMPTHRAEMNTIGLLRSKIIRHFDIKNETQTTESDIYLNFPPPSKAHSNYQMQTKHH